MYGNGPMATGSSMGGAVSPREQGRVSRSVERIERFRESVGGVLREIDGELTRLGGAVPSADNAKAQGISPSSGEVNALENQVTQMEVLPGQLSDLLNRLRQL